MYGTVGAAPGPGLSGKHPLRGRLLSVSSRAELFKSPSGPQQTLTLHLPQILLEQTAPERYPRYSGFFVCFFLKYPLSVALARVRPETCGVLQAPRPSSAFQSHEIRHVMAA